MISFKIIDDFLIDSVFQPICNGIQLFTGCSKRVPAAIGCFISAGSIIPLLFFIILLEDTLLRVVGSIGWIFCIGLVIRGTAFILQELRDRESSSSLDSKRLTDSFHRKMSLVSSTGVTLIAGPIFSLLQESSIGFALTLGAVSSLCAIYFEACTNFPKPPKKKVSPAKLSLQN